MLAVSGGLAGGAGLVALALGLTGCEAANPDFDPPTATKTGHIEGRCPPDTLELCVPWQDCPAGSCGDGHTCRRANMDGAWIVVCSPIDAGVVDAHVPDAFEPGGGGF